MKRKRNLQETTYFVLLYTLSGVLSLFNATTSESTEASMAWCVATIFAASAFAQFMRLPLDNEDSDNILGND